MRTRPWTAIPLTAGALLLAAGCAGGADAQPSVSKTTITATPDSCLAALKAADALQQDSYDFSKLIIEYPDVVQAALYAGLHQSASEIDGVTASLNSLTRRISPITDSVGVHGDEYRSAAADCRAGK
jgi:hypothetical protein